MSKNEITIGLSDYGSKIDNYINWLKLTNHSIAIVKLNHNNSKPEDILNCTSLLLPGGGDLNPKLYDQENYNNVSLGIDDARDKFENSILRLALEKKLPILGICRGLQLVNVFLGGTLFQHIDGHKGSSDNEDVTHEIKVNQNSLLYSIVRLENGVVNSSHHQAIDKIAPCLKVSSRSSDGIIESLEWEDSNDKSPLLLVQWHPERMQGKEKNPFSKKILNWFLKCQIN